ncbi:MAG: aldo/keto reductase [Limisphaerales bacterium]
MNFRDFGRLDWKVSALGFGCMRLPTMDGNPLGPNIDRAQAERMIHCAIDGGVNYFDTAYVYHDGSSEAVLGEALLGGRRQRVKLATKSPVWLIESGADFDRLLDEQLRRLQTDYVDFYLFHALNRRRWQDCVLRHDLLSRADAAIRDGRIRHLGFSFHDGCESLPEILGGYDRWAFCQIQYNYMDPENQAGVKGLKLAAAKGLAVVVMEPLLGGRLANPPAALRQVIDRSTARRSPAEWALQWLWDQPEVAVVLSGMSTLSQVEANLDSASRSRIHSFQAADFALIEQLQRKYSQGALVPCTKCNYCTPCPNGVNIPLNFEIFNDAHLHEDLPGARLRYQLFLAPEARAGACEDCDACEPQCPQQIPISDWMPKVQALLGADGTQPAG